MLFGSDVLFFVASELGGSGVMGSWCWVSTRFWESFEEEACALVVLALPLGVDPIVCFDFPGGTVIGSLDAGVSRWCWFISACWGGCFCVDIVVDFDEGVWGGVWVGREVWCVCGEGSRICVKSCSMSHAMV